MYSITFSSCYLHLINMEVLDWLIFTFDLIFLLLVFRNYLIIWVECFLNQTMNTHEKSKIVNIFPHFYFFFQIQISIFTRKKERRKLHFHSKKKKKKNCIFTIVVYYHFPHSISLLKKNPLPPPLSL